MSEPQVKDCQPSPIHHYSFSPFTRQGAWSIRGRGRFPQGLIVAQRSMEDGVAEDVSPNRQATTGKTGQTTTVLTQAPSLG